MTVHRLKVVTERYILGMRSQKFLNMVEKEMGSVWKGLNAFYTERITDVMRKLF